jgi:circadian clock protein KaiC
MEGARAGEPVLFISLSETDEELRGVARSHDWSLEGVEVREHAADEEQLPSPESQSIFRPGEVEFPLTIRRLLELID